MKLHDENVEGIYEEIDEVKNGVKGMKNWVQDRRKREEGIYGKQWSNG